MNKVYYSKVFIPAKEYMCRYMLREMKASKSVLQGGEILWSTLLSH